MNTFDRGPGRYIAGCTIGVDGGALAVLERSHVRITPPPPEPLVRGGYISQKTLEEAERDAWESRFTLRYVEVFPAERPRSEFADRVRALIEQSPLDGETSVVLDATDLGTTMREPFYKRIGRENYVTHVSFAREATTTTLTTAVTHADARGAIVALYEAGRLKIANQIPHQNEMERIIEQATRGDELSRIALAIGLACHHAKAGRARGPWPGRQRPKAGTREAQELESFTMLQRDLAQLRRDKEEAHEGRRDE